MASSNPKQVNDQSWTHGSAIVDKENEVRIHYIDCAAHDEEKGVMLLIHGYPQTSYQWRYVITPLSEKGLRVIAPDYRGAGDSSRPKSGFDKKTIADDLYQLVHDHLSIREPIHVVGQDIGGMIAHAYAAWHPEHTKSVMWGECPLPGAKPYESGFKNSPKVWHFAFHQQLDLPELLTQGRERVYLKHFYDRLCFNPSGITPGDVDHYGASFAQPGGMRCGFELYRAFPQDSKDNQAQLRKTGKLKVPAAALNGEQSFLLEIAKEQTEEFYKTCEVVTIDRSGHWIGEENPQDFVDKVFTFVEKHLR
ncbi:alpha/beta-hydrolase [Tothia fuscella]|uniref:Alpha/beta-hydrolase n=1 Tax=Tothia fuscella TaxID=1048955 RepID=A0A9P4TSU6_9PEZI|nr:alpha/beta-hydrolase [Tothia fuscella]